MNRNERIERLKNLPAAKRQLLLKMLREEAASGGVAPGIPRRLEKGPAPLSFAQQRLFFLDRLTPGSPAYNLPFAVRLEGDLDVATLRRALDEIVDRHEVLRARFLAAGGLPAQEIVPAAGLPLPIVDLGALLAGEAEARRLSGAEARRPFDLEAGPLLRAVLLRRGAADHRLLFTFHHAVFDGWSTGNLTREVATLYAAFAAGRPSPLPELAIQYTDFAAWQRTELLGEALAAQLAYWRGQLAGAPAVLALPTDRPRPGVQRFRGAVRGFALGGDLSAALERLGQANGATLFMTLLAAFQVLLGRISGQSDILVGSPVANRTQPELEPLLGFFVNVLVLRADLADNPGFRCLVRRVAESTLGAQDHQEVPFEKLVDELQLERSLSHTPLFQVVFAFQNATEEAPVQLGEGLRLSSLGVSSGTSKFDLSLSIAQGAGQLFGNLEYSTDLFDAATIERLLGHFEALLRSVVAAADFGIWELPLVREAERHQLQVEWSAPREAFPAGSCLHQTFAIRAAASPGAVALVWEGEALSYGELDRRANGFAHRLLFHGATPGARIGLCAERGPGLVIGILGILKAGGAYLPLDPSLPEERLSFQLSDAAVQILVTTPGTRRALPAYAGRVVLLEGEESGRYADPAVPVGPEMPAYVIYTSGSTGRPKGVVVTHANGARLFTATAARFGFGPSDTWTLFHSYAFDFSVWELWGALLYGGRLVVVPQEVSRNPEVLHALLARERVTILNQTPSAFRQLIQADARSSARLDSLRFVIFGGEALEPASLRAWVERYGEERPCLVNMYGITETTVHVTFRRLGRAEVAGGAGSVLGVPISDLSVRVLDRSGQPVPIGVAGELQVGGAGLALGYLGRASLTAERFVPDPLGAPGARLYRSGDLGRFRASGELEYLGRIDDQVKIRGFRIELGEIEAVLCRHHEVAAAVVIAREDAPGERRLAAYVVGAQGATPKIEELRGYLRKELPEYMVPAAFLSLPTLPLTANGKVDRSALPAPGLERPELAQSYVAPRTPEEEVLCGIWCQALGVGEVGVYDNFFALGGDSILSLRVVALAGERGLPVTLSDLFRCQTVAELAAGVRIAALGGGEPPYRPTEPFSLLAAEDRDRLPADVVDAYPLSLLQAGMLYHMSVTPDDPLYQNVDSWRLRGSFVAELFSEAVRRAVRRHPMLRTSFDMTGYSEPLQLVHREAVLPIKVSDLRHLSAAEQERRIDERIAVEKRRPAELWRAPQLRFYIDLRDEGIFQLTLVENHAIFDGWSLHSALAEMFGLYFALLAGGEAPEEPPLTLTYRDYIHLERQTLASPESAAFWKEALRGLTLPELPRGSAWTPDGRFPRMRSLHLPFPQELYRGLEAVAHQAAVPLKSVVLAAHLKVLSLLGGQPDVVSGLVMNGRLEERDGDRVLGLFLNTLPCRLRLENETWTELARRTFALERTLLPHRRYPFAALQRQWGERALLDVAFNYIHFHVIEDILRAGDLEVLEAKGAEGASFKLLAHFMRTPDASEMRLELEYDSAALPEGQVEVFLGYYRRVLAAMAAEPAALHQATDFLSVDERRRLLREWNAEAALHSPRGSLSVLFEEQAALRPQAVAVVCEGQALSYGELNAGANRLARSLRRHGVRAGMPVGICVERSLEMAVGLLGILKASGAYVPLDPSYPPERLAFMLRDALGSVESPVLVTQAELAARFAATATELALSALRIVLLAAGREESNREESGDLLDKPAPNDLAYVLYTSGSTGRPKGALVPHGNVVRLLAATQEEFGFGPGDVWTLFHSFAFDFSVWELWGALAYGGRVVIVPYWMSRSPDAFHELVERERVTILNQTPSAFHQLVQADEPRAERGGASLALRWVIFGGEALDLAALAPWFDRHGDDQPRLVNMYGITETTVHVTYRPLRRADLAVGGASPIGRAIPDLRLHLLNAERNLVPIGVPGEIHVGGAGLARGYLGRPELTAERFVPDPFATVPGERSYRTGDLARYRPDGDLEFLGRIDHQVKIRGFRIELGEIEAALALHPAVRESVVVSRADGAREARLVAYVAVAPGTVRAEELRSHLRRGLPDHMVPAAFVFLEALPRDPNGKVDRRALAELKGEPEARSAAPYAPPGDALEELVAGVFKEVLGVEQVGIHDNFFDLGGHSLVLVQVQRRLRALLDREIAMVDLFRASTVAALARLLANPTDTGEASRQGDERAATRRELRRRRERRRAEEPLAEVPEEEEVAQEVGNG